jgi:glycosyltransferase involved in cell wall biosynthesis
VVHSQTSRKFLEDLGYKGKIHVINFLAYPHNESLLADSELCRLRTQFSVEDDQILIGSFGFIGPTKRMNVLIEALSKLEKKINYKLLVVGQGIDLSSLASSKHLQNKIVCLGYVSNDEFVQMLKLTDIVVNLRYPSMGETSATLIQAFSLSRACIVTNHGWFSEIPDDCAWKIGFGESEIDELESALLKLSDDKPTRIELGARAKMFVDENCSGSKIASRYVEALGGSVIRKSRVEQSKYPHEGGWVRGYFNQRLNEILPPG